MRIQNSLRNINSGLVGHILKLLLSFATRTVFIYTLGVTYLGLSGLITNILVIFSLAELGVGQAITYSLYKALAENDEKKICALMNLYKNLYRKIGLVILIIGVLFTPFLNYVIKTEQIIPNLELIYLLFVFNTAFSYFYIYRTSLIIADQKNYIVTKINNYFLVSSNILQIVVLLLTNNYLLFLIIQLSATFIQNLYLSKISLKLYPFLIDETKYEIDLEEKKGIYSNIKALVLYKIGTVSLNSTDTIIISTFVSIIAVGLYSNYSLLIMSIGGVISIIFSSLTASIGNFVSKENKDRQLNIFNIINFATFWVYGVCSIGLFLLLTPFIQLWLGNDFILEPSVVFIIVLNFYLGGMLFGPYTYRQTMGLFIYGKYRPIISAILNLILSLTFVQFYGIEGVFWATTLTRILTNIWYDPYIVLKKGLNSSVLMYFKKYVEYLIVIALGGYLSYLVVNSLSLRLSFGTFIFNGLICLLIPNIIIITKYFKTYEFQYIVNIIKTIFAKKFTKVGGKLKGR
jgi:O-antigen/teichoic acid export membrane protein